MEIVFNDQQRDDWKVPTPSDMANLSRDELRESAVILSYAIQHGSGANVKLSLPFAYCFAHLVAADDKGKSGSSDPVTLLRELDEAGRNADLGTITVRNN